MKNLYAAISLVVICLIPGILSGQENDPYVNPVRYRGQLSFTVINDSCNINQLEVWLPKLLDWENQKDIKIHRVAPPAVVDTTDSEGKSGIYYWKFPKQPLAGNSLKFSVDFSCTSYETKFEIDPTRIGKYETSTAFYQRYTKSEPYLECDDPGIEHLSRKVVENEPNPYFKARKIFDWVLENIDYQLVPGLKGALFTLQNRYGECGDYSALFIALCRAVGIPARPVVGIWANSFNEPHVWAEFYLPNYGWLPVDASQADGWGNVDSYFGHLDNGRIILSKGFNVILVPEIQIKTLPIFQVGAWWYEGGETGAHEDISLTIRREDTPAETVDRNYRNEKYGLNLDLPPGWQVASEGGRGNYSVCVEIWNDAHDSRVYLYGRKWRAGEPHHTPEEITTKDIDFFTRNSAKFELLHQGPEKFIFVTGYGFLAITTSYGIGDYYSRYIYFTKDDLIYWLIFQTTEDNYMKKNSWFNELANGLKSFTPGESE